MPNTLAHLGVQALLTRAAIPGMDLKWVWAGCVLPDLPWILQRLVEGRIAGLSAFDLRLYAVVQSSLFVTLLAAGALALLSRWPGRTFATLALGAVLHLLLDATETKWANGVLLFAPASWELLNFGLYWPDGWTGHLLTALGAVHVAHAVWKARRHRPAPIRAPRPDRAVAAAGLCAVYMLLPLAFLDRAAAQDLHHVATLRGDVARSGRAIEIDRGQVIATGAQGAIIRPGTGPALAVIADGLDGARTVSLRGRFVDHDTIRATALHVHATGQRDRLTLVGLVVVLGWWVVWAWRAGVLSAVARSLAPARPRPPRSAPHPRSRRRPPR
ncbi:hypothetical protein [Limimaricola hongkongensis]|uniref:hypothetical protein n=1 Tax=Limimaricola hongkongensis TaxID=278132 RepID=UPI000370C012|nr:hypothetical protein [Limimaricola hongkongensis]